MPGGFHSLSLNGPDRDGDQFVLGHNDYSPQRAGQLIQKSVSIDWIGPQNVDGFDGSIGSTVELAGQSRTQARDIRKHLPEALPSSVVLRDPNVETRALSASGQAHDRGRVASRSSHSLPL